VGELVEVASIEQADIENLKKEVTTTNERPSDVPC
jgi:hypothetical protein